MPPDSTAITINGIKCWDEGVEEVFSRQGAQAVRRIKCAWSDRINVVKYLEGGSQNVGGVTIAQAGQPYPDIPNLLFVDSIRVTGEGDKRLSTAGQIAYKTAILECTYRNLDFGNTDQTISVLDLNFGAEVRTIPKELLKFSDDNSAVPFGAPEYVTLVPITLTRCNLPLIPLARLIAVADAPLNSTPFTRLLGTPTGQTGAFFTDTRQTDLSSIPAKKLRFEGARAIRKFSMSGTTYDLAISLTYRSIEWDKVEDFNGAYRTVVRQNGTPLIKTSDLNLLFTDNTA
jgi:hypothetical protein